MPRLSNVKSGAIVSVPEEKVARLGTDWVRIDGPAPVEPVAVLDDSPTDAAAIPAVDLSDLTVAELQEEIDRRNRGRDVADLIDPVSGKKADLVAALELDDMAAAGPVADALAASE